MASNNPFTHPIDQILRTHAYGGITIERLITTFCEETCRDWRPLECEPTTRHIFEPLEIFEIRCERLYEIEEESRICQGHLVKHETLQGMLRSYSFKPGLDDRSRDGSLSITILPWDGEEERLTSSRVVRARVFDYNCRWSNSLYVIDGLGSSALRIELRPWRLEASN